MSQSYPENPRGIRARVSRWNSTRRGTKTLKAAYAQAARDVKRMDPAVREAIGRSNMTRSDLQQLASLNVDARFRPDRYGDLSQRLGQEAQTRLEQAGPAPSSGWIARKNPFSRWNRNQRQGTKALKQAFTQAARDVKRTDPAVRWAIGRSTINRSDLAALASSRMDEVFRPEGRFQAVPGQQAGAGRQGVQPPDAGRQEPSPQQSEQMAQRIAALQQSIAENQSRALALMEENNRLQAEMRQLLETRVQQLQQEAAGANQAIGTGRDLGQQDLGQQDLGQQGRPLDDDVRLDNPVIRTDQDPNQQQPGENQPAGELGEGGEPRAVGEQAETGERPAAGEAEVGGGNAPEVGEGNDPQAAQEPAEDWTVSSETQGESARAAEAAEAAAASPEQTGPEQTGAEAEQPAQADPALTAQAAQPGITGQQAGVTGQQPGPTGQQPGVTGQQPDVTGQQPGVAGQQPANQERLAAAVGQGSRQQGSAAGEKSSAELDAKFAQEIAFGGGTPLNSVSSQHTDGAVRAGGDDASRRQRNTQAPTRNGQSGKDGR
jgi:hypothetical protein